MADTVHASVLSEEVLQWLAPAGGQTLVDGTLGLGGHAERLLERLGQDGVLIGVDKDEAALTEARKRLERFGDRLMIIHDDFRNIAKRLREMGKAGVDGLLLDLGVSSLQLDAPEKGFSFRAAGPLDMRMDQRQRLTAKDIVNTYPPADLEKILYEYGEERFARRIVSRIVETRAAKPFESTADLEALIFHTMPRSQRYGRIHPATRTFQALRIAVNDEIGALEDLLSQALSILREGGKAAVISFHSLEDRLVKNAFRSWHQEGFGKVLTKKPVRPAEAEIARNPRARSAKLRVFEKGAGL